jgi:hypothetical protein
VANNKPVTTLARFLTGICGVLLLIVAYLHSLGFEDLNATLASSGVSGFFAEALPMQWLFFSWHLSVIAVLLIWVALSSPKWSLPAAIFCTAITFGDFLWVFSVAGWFPGTMILFGVAVVLLFVSVTLYRAGHASAT